MSGEENSGENPEPEAPEAEEIARRYLDLWQDQMTALAADPEFAEAWRKLVESLGVQTAAWQSQGLPTAGGLPDPLAAMQAMMAGVKPTPVDRTEGRGDDGSDETADRADGKTAQRTAAAAAASRRGGDDLEQLAARLDELESRLAALEAGPANQGGRSGKRDRKTRS